MRKKTELIVALDVDTFEAARRLVETLKETVDIYKVGSQLFTACGPVIVRYLSSQGKRVFLDLKFHDIPNTVANAVSVAVGLNRCGHQPFLGGENAGTPGALFLLTLHICGGEEMLIRAREACDRTARDLGVLKPKLIGVTVLTSMSNRDNIPPIILERSLLARKVGLDGVVVSSQESSSIRHELGGDFLIITPGIRPEGADKGDQKRVATPRAAVCAGSDFLVVGRPIVNAVDPYKAAREMREEMRRADGKD